MAIKDMTGKTFGMLTVIKLSRISGHSIWLVRCICGIEKEVLQNNLHSGMTVSCGRCRRLKHGLSSRLLIITITMTTGINRRV